MFISGLDTGDQKKNLKKGIRKAKVKRQDMLNFQR